MSKRRKTQRDVEPKKLSKRREEENDEFEMDEEEDDQMPESEEVHSTFSNPGECSDVRIDQLDHLA